MKSASMRTSMIDYTEGKREERERINKIIEGIKKTLIESEDMCCVDTCDEIKDEINEKTIT